MVDNLISKLVPHQGCVITRIDDGIQIAGSGLGRRTPQISECTFTAAS